MFSRYRDERERKQGRRSEKDLRASSQHEQQKRRRKDTSSLEVASRNTRA